MKKSLANVHPSWLEHFKAEFNKNYMVELNSFLANERKKSVVFPKESEMLNAFTFVSFHDVSVVILGQDPYHGAGQAHGLCFSVQKPTSPPPSLVNVFKEIERDLDIPRPNHGCLTHWAYQGILLLNTILTVRESEPLSHAHQGWETFTDSVIEKLNDQRDHLIFVLWGASAQKKKIMIDQNKHLVLMAPHPSPLSAHRGFHGCGHFSAINEQLEKWSKAPVDWSLPS